MQGQYTMYPKGSTSISVATIAINSKNKIESLKYFIFIVENFLN